MFPLNPYGRHQYNGSKPNSEGRHSPDRYSRRQRLLTRAAGLGAFTLVGLVTATTYLTSKHEAETLRECAEMLAEIPEDEQLTGGALIALSVREQCRYVEVNEYLSGQIDQAEITRSDIYAEADRHEVSTQGALFYGAFAVAGAGIIYVATKPSQYIRRVEPGDEPF